MVNVCQNKISKVLISIEPLQSKLVGTGNGEGKGAEGESVAIETHRKRRRQHSRDGKEHIVRRMHRTRTGATTTTAT